MPDNYIVTDVCDTLFFSNTTFDFIKFCITNNKLNPSAKRTYNFYLRSRSPLFWILLIGNKILRKDYHKRIAVSLLKGVDETELKKWVVEFYVSVLEPVRIPAVTDLLKHYEGLQLVLASSGLSPVVEYIAQVMQAKFVASELHFINGKCSGILEADITGKKLTALQNNLGINHASIKVAISDNLSDEKLLRTAPEAYAICYDHKQELFWKRDGNAITTILVKKPLKRVK